MHWDKQVRRKRKEVKRKQQEIQKEIQKFNQNLYKGYRIVEDYLEEKHRKWSNRVEYKELVAVYDNEAHQVTESLKEIRQVVKNNPEGFEDIVLLYGKTVEKIINKLQQADKMMLLGDPMLYGEMITILEGVENAIQNIKTGAMESIKDELEKEKIYVQILREKIGITGG